jgi:hypothetical protein
VPFFKNILRQNKRIYMRFDFEFFEHRPENENREDIQRTIIQADSYDDAVKYFVNNFPNTNIISINTLKY